MKAANFIKLHPTCCFCGGSTPATTIDHQPAKILFTDKHRPKGLEFPACDGCNKQTSGDECVLALVCRITGSLRLSVRPDKGLERALSTIAVRFPALFDDLQKPSPIIVKDGRPTSTVDISHRQFGESICRVSAKLALATYYDVTGRVAGQSSVIDTQWAHNQLKEVAGPVDELLGNIPNYKALKQRSWDTTSTFYVKYFFDGDTLYQSAVLHETVALMARLGLGEGRQWGKNALYKWSPTVGAGIRLRAS